MDRLAVLEELGGINKMAMWAGFFDEFEKLAANVLMKKLSPAAKKLMDRMTGAAHGASVPQTRSARQLRHALTGKKAPKLMTEMHGMGDMLSSTEQAARKGARQHFEGVLQSQGKVYKGTPGMEQSLSSIQGHPRALTRTGAQVGGQAGTVSKGTVASRPGAIKARQQLGTAQTAVRPTVQPMGTAPTVVAPQMQRAAA